MKNRIIFVIAALALVSCTVSELANDTAIIRPKGDVYTASFEQSDTKVYVDGNLNTLWTGGDEISIFTTTYNQHYRFDGNTGDDNGSFSEVSSSFFSGGSVPTVYAVYPYSENTSITSEGVITLELPAVQNYAENSYGLGANTMVAVTENKSDKALCFKSLCGYVVVRLYGEGVVKSITLSGNNDELLSGPATVAPVYGQAPSVVMSDSAGTSITLDCGIGVELGKSPADATDFWFVVPPVTFSYGFTLIIERIDSWGMSKTTFLSREVVRNVKNAMSPLMVDFTIPTEGIIDFKDISFKDYCINTFDTSGDRELSFEEAAVVTAIDCQSAGINSVDELIYFTALEELNISNNPIGKIDLSGNRQLIHLNAKNTNVSEVNLCYNAHLKTANFDFCEDLHSIFVRGFEEECFPCMITCGDITYHALNNITEYLPDFNYSLLVLPTTIGIYAVALTDITGIGASCPIEGMHTPTKDEAQCYSVKANCNIEMLYEGYASLIDVLFITSTPTGQSFQHEHTIKTGAYWTIRNYQVNYYYCISLKAAVYLYGLVCTAPDTCGIDLTVHKTGVYTLWINPEAY